MASFAPAKPAQFWVTIDTEEDFDWHAPFRRTGYRLESLNSLGDCQSYFQGQGVAPVYLVDWPVMESPAAVAVLGEAQQSGAAEIGAQLHPWVNPPHQEEVNAANSYTGNLPYDLQREKLRMLRDQIATVFGHRPRIYRAGRYGLGARTGEILRELGFRCDTSVRSGFDYRKGHGPDYRNMPLAPWWVGDPGDLLEIPLTTVFVGPLRESARRIWHFFADGRSPTVSLLSRLRLIERIAVTPEGIPAEKACEAIDVALAGGLKLLNLSFHSPSLAPGNTPYVRDRTELAALYRWWDQVLAHLDRSGVVAGTLDTILAAIELPQ